MDSSNFSRVTSFPATVMSSSLAEAAKNSPSAVETAYDSLSIGIKTVASSQAGVGSIKDAVQDFKSISQAPIASTSVAGAAQMSDPKSYLNLSSQDLSTFSQSYSMQEVSRHLADPKFDSAHHLETFSNLFMSDSNKSKPGQEVSSAGIIMEKRAASTGGELKPGQEVSSAGFSIGEPRPEMGQISGELKPGQEVSSAGFSIGEPTPEMGQISGESSAVATLGGVPGSVSRSGQSSVDIIKNFESTITGLVTMNRELQKGRT